MALQADAVAIGRLTGLALAAGGKPALLRALDLLAEEIWIGLGKNPKSIREQSLRRCQAATCGWATGLLGVTSLAALGPKHVRPAPVVGEGSYVFSAFPHLDRDLAKL